MTTTDRAAYTAGLRELANRLDANPDCPLPYDGDVSALNWILDSREEVAAVARLLGNVTKGRDGEGALKLTGGLHGLRVQVLTMSGVCERVEVGTTTETREVEVCPFCEAEIATSPDGTRSCSQEGGGHYLASPPALRTVEVEVPKYETRCPPSILAPVALTDAEQTEADVLRDERDRALDQLDQAGVAL